MSVDYRVEVWDKTRKRYAISWVGKNLGMARKVFNKPWLRKSWLGKRRIVETTERVVESSK